MTYEVRVLKTVSRFIEEMDAKLKARVYWVIGLLNEMGSFLGEPYSKKITNHKRLYELRIQSGNLSCRLFYFHSGQKVYVITSGFMKNQQKIPPKEIERAGALMKQYEEENHD